MWIFSCEFWLFPNLFDDDKGVVDSFLPVVTFSVRKGDSFATKFARLACLGLVLYVSYSVFKEPKMITSFSDASFQGVSDILEWGQLKLAGNATEQAPSGRKSLAQIEAELSREEEAKRKAQQKSGGEESKSEQHREQPSAGEPKSESAKSDEDGDDKV